MPNNVKAQDRCHSSNSLEHLHAYLSVALASMYKYMHVSHSISTPNTLTSTVIPLKSDQINLSYLLNWATRTFNGRWTGWRFFLQNVFRYLKWLGDCQRYCLGLPRINIHWTTLPLLVSDSILTTHFPAAIQVRTGSPKVSQEITFCDCLNRLFAGQMPFPSPNQ